jgi:hypothetical protein
VAADRQGGADYDGTALVGSGVLDEQSPRYRLTSPQAAPRYGLHNDHLPLRITAAARRRSARSSRGR